MANVMGEISNRVMVAYIIYFLKIVENGEMKNVEW